MKADLAAFGALTRNVDVPVLAKGIQTSDDATLALTHGAKGLIVSSYGGPAGPEKDPVILKLRAIVDAVGGRAPVLVDGSFRRGTDILKALACDRRAARPHDAVGARRLRAGRRAAPAGDDSAGTGRRRRDRRARHAGVD